MSSIPAPPSSSKAIASPVILRHRNRLQPWKLLWLVWLVLTNPALGGTLQCTTYEEKTLQRWHTICDDGTGAVSRYNRVLNRWETTVTTSPHRRRTCTARADPFTNTVDVYCH
jgi:hypothetical protein